MVKGTATDWLLSNQPKVIEISEQLPRDAFIYGWLGAIDAWYNEVRTRTFIEMNRNTGLTIEFLNVTISEEEFRKYLNCVIDEQRTCGDVVVEFKRPG